MKSNKKYFAIGLVLVLIVLAVFGIVKATGCIWQRKTGSRSGKSGIAQINPV